ncbi:MAG: cold shock domain-containing protein [Desulfuromonadales bacterium]
MNGRIKMFNTQKGFGFILGEDGKERFFHISSVKSTVIPSQGMLVVFESISSKKGLTANNIFIQEEKSKPNFINFGTTSVRLSNIKSYYVDNKTVTQMLDVPLSELPNKEEYLWGQVMTKYSSEEYAQMYRDSDLWVDCRGTEGRIRRTITFYYLHIVTFQKENYSWRGTKEEIQAMLSSLETMLN